MTKGVVRHLVTLDRVVTPDQVFEALCASDPTALWWESLGERGSQTSVIGFGHPLTLVAGDEWEGLARSWTPDPSLASDDTHIPLGVVGWLAYDLTSSTLGIDVGGPGEGEPSRSALVEVTRAVSWNHQTGEIWLFAQGSDWSGDNGKWRDRVDAAIHTAPTPAPLELPPAHSLDDAVAWRDTPDGYRDKIRAAKDAIREGQVYQVCVTTEVTVDTRISDFDLYRLLRQHNPAPHQALLRINGLSVLASSPETFLHITSAGKVTTKPIKGTRPRGGDDNTDQAIAHELAASEKEQAENLMIVDLMRNDLSRVCDEASIEVPQLLEVETYPSVHQLVSTVTGTLRPGVSAVEAVKACFPAGSMTGAPKHRAVSILTGIESGDRGVYSGCFGIFSVDGSVTLGMTIRTAIVEPDRVSLGVGGGITWSSVVDDEIAEVGHKARAVLRCLGVSNIQYS
jgi:anthranilate/para-aminobenzoate synthase component I